MKTLHVDMPDILEAMTTYAEGMICCLDLQTGLVDRRFPGLGSFEDDDEEEAERDPERFVRIPQREAREDHALMEDFAETLDEEDVRQQLEVALDGRGSFGRFRSVLERYPDLQRRWHEVLQQAVLDDALDWLRSLDLEPEFVLPTPPAPEPPPVAKSEPFPTLYELLVLGSDKTELIEGAVQRSWHAPSPALARTAFVRLARELHERAGISWRKRFVQDKKEIEVEGIRLRQAGRSIELRLPLTIERWRLFAG